MSLSDGKDPVLARQKLLQRFILRTAGKGLGAALAVFVLARVLGPNLINMHDDVALAGGIACFAVAAAIAIWLWLRLNFDLSQYAKARRELAPGPFLKVED